MQTLAFFQARIFTTGTEARMARIYFFSFCIFALYNKLEDFASSGLAAKGASVLLFNQQVWVKNSVTWHIVF